MSATSGGAAPAAASTGNRLRVCGLRRPLNRETLVNPKGTPAQGRLTRVKAAVKLNKPVADLLNVPLSKFADTFADDLLLRGKMLPAYIAAHFALGRGLQ